MKKRPKDAGCGDAQERHEPGNETVSRPLEHVKKDSEERPANDDCEQPALEQVGDEQGGRRLVEPVLFLEHERLVYRERGADHRREYKQDRGEREGLGDLSARGQLG